MESIIDQSKAIRTGEELPIEKINDWIKTQIPDLDGFPEITQFSGGASNWTYRLKYNNYDLIMRRPPAGTKATSAHDMKREYEIQKALKPFFPVPKMYCFCNDPAIIGCDFYIMERVEGIIPRSNLPKGLNLSIPQTRELCINMIDKLIELHKIDIQNTGLDKIGKGTGYAQRQIDGWSSRFEKSKTWNVPDCKKVINWLKNNVPKEEHTCLIHNDYRFDNLILATEEPSKIIGVLDWEMATIGNPLMDLGNTLAYWVEEADDFIAKSTRRQPTNAKGMLKRKEVLAYYCQKMNLEGLNFTFYEVYGLFRLVVILQQIYYRFHHKQTNNPAFKNFWILVHYLNWRCKRIIKNQ